METMGNGLLSLSALFQNKFFRIPDYQRGYAWKHEQLADFWEDLLNLHEGRYHYTGMLSLKEIKPQEVKFWDDDDWRWLREEEGYTPYHVVDGQQRLTTISILMNEIVVFVKGLPENNGKDDRDILFGNKSLKEIKDKYILVIRQPENITKTYLFGYETDNPSARYMKYKVFNEPDGGTVFETYYTKNLKYAKNFFADNLVAMYRNDGIDGIERLYKKMTLRLMFNLHEIEDDYDVFVAFETMNNRGKKLTNLELLKNRLIYLTTLFDDAQFDKTDKEQLRKNINDAWKEVYYQLGRNKDVPLSDDEFLRAHWITYFRYSRNTGDDYIRFLLGNFSAKNVFEKYAVTQEVEDTPVSLDYEQDEADNEIETQVEPEMTHVSKLAPKEINDYVNSLKSLAEYWYYSFFPYEREFIAEKEEKVWIDKLNRIGIGYFRPLVVAAMSKEKTTASSDRILLFKAIERFIFVIFRLGRFLSVYQSSVYNNKARDVVSGVVTLDSIAADLDEDVNEKMDSAVKKFIIQTNDWFNKREGIYSWKPGLRYFLYEYEYEKAIKNNIEKVNWNMFTRFEKDKVTIEHILPQTPTKWYWRNMFRAYTAEEIKFLSASLGNMLPLSQSINSSLQNDSFPDKKDPKTKWRRGYINGSHSEIEVAQKQDWTAENILERGMMLLDYMEKRWRLKIDDSIKKEWLHIPFVENGREVPPEIPETIPPTVETERHDSGHSRSDFWKKFKAYCKKRKRYDIASKERRNDLGYFIDIDRSGYKMSFLIFEDEILLLSMSVSKEEFERLESKKPEIEALYGSPLIWGGGDNSRFHFIRDEITDALNPDLYEPHFEWMVEHFDRLKDALEAVDGGYIRKAN